MALKPGAGTLEAFAISLGTMAPTLAMSFSVSLTTRAAGAATPLAFLAGGLVAAVVAFSFIAFSRDIVGAGSAMPFVESVFGRRWSRLTGWTMLLAYMAFAAASCGLAGEFLTAAAAHVWGASPLPMWFGVALAASVAAPALAMRPLSTSSHLALLLEAVSVAAILWLAVAIFSHAPPSTAPLRLDPAKGLSGLAAGMVPAILAFAGFEAATTVATETRGATRAVPRAILLSLALVTVFFIVVSYAQVLGFGPGRTAALAASAAPIDVLASRFVSGDFGVFLDLAAATSAFACALSATTGASRLLYALGEQGLGRGLARLDARTGAPRRAVVGVGLGAVGALVAFGALGADDYTGLLLTAGVVALILVYIAVCASQAVRSLRGRSWAPAAAGGFGCALLVWALVASLDWSGASAVSYAPVAVVVWLVLGAAWTLTAQRRAAGDARPALTRAEGGGDRPEPRPAVPRRP